MYSLTNERVAVGAIGASSAAAVAFLLWLLYVHHPSPALAQQWIFLPRLNALLNGMITPSAATHISPESEPLGRRICRF